MLVHLEPYNPQWNVEFQRVKAELEELLRDVPLVGIEHVGSTSVVGLVAKPVIDIDIIVSGPEELEVARRVMVNPGGYLDLGEMDIAGRFAFRQPGYGKADAALGGPTGPGQEMRRNTYVMLNGCRALRNHLDVRQKLRNDASVRDEYARVKQELAQHDFEHIGQYVDGKTGILLRILQDSGWSKEDIDKLRPVTR